MKKIRNGNRGSALIAVIVCMLFIGIIASIIVTMVRTNLYNSSTLMKASDNFYEGEEAIDELKNSLRNYSEQAFRKAYEKWLESYSSFDESQAVEFRKLFAKELKELIKNYIQIPGGTTPTGSILDLMYNTHVDIPKDEHGNPIPPTLVDENGVITIKNITIIQTDENGNVTTITTDLKLTADTPTMQIGTRTGISTAIADYALVADETVDFSGGSGAVIVGSIYGGGKSGEEAGIPKYNGTGILVNDTAANAIKLYSDYIISRNSFVAKRGKLEVYGKQQYPYSTSKKYANIWVKNILQGGTDSGASDLAIQGICNVADDLTIDSASSKFAMKGSGSAYYGYNTSSDATSAETNSSIVINGKNVTVDLSEAGMLWLAGKSYVSVPALWGDINPDRSTTYLQGESISYRSLQPAYLLPGECIVGINHNPMTREEYQGLLDEITAGTKDQYYIDITRGSAGNGINLELYLDTTKNAQGLYTKAFYASTVQYKESVAGDTEDELRRKQLVYLYMNFANPNRAAAFFRDYSKAYNEVVTARAAMADSSTKLVVNTTGSYVDSSTGALVLSDSKVKNTGNILWYAASESDPSKMEYRLYAANTDYTSPDVTNAMYSKQMDFRKLSTSLDLSTMSSLNKDITDLLINFPYVEDADHANKVAKIDGVDGLFEVPGTLLKRQAYVVGASGDVWITSTGIRFGSASASVTTHDINDEHIVDKDGNNTTVINAGIVIAGGDVHIEGGLEFWGTIISKGTIHFGGSNCKVLSAAGNIKKLIESNPVVWPYFSEDTDDNTVAQGDLKNLIKIEYVDWKKE